MSERRDRTDHYVGPEEMLSREDLPLLDDGTVVGEVKEDGVWHEAVVRNGICERILSRTAAELSCDLIGKRLASDGNGTFVGELITDIEGTGVKAQRTGTKRLRWWECLEWNDIGLRDLPRDVRRESLVMIYDSKIKPVLGNANLLQRVGLVERKPSGFSAWYDSLMGADATKVIGMRPEGMVLKWEGPNRARKADGKVPFWKRVKPINTVDYVVMGPDGTAKKGTPKIALGLYFLQPDGSHILQQSCSLTWRLAREGFHGDGTKWCLASLKLGDVVEVKGFEMHASGALRSGDIVRPRPDKYPVDCTYEAAIMAAPCAKD